MGGTLGWGLSLLFIHRSFAVQPNAEIWIEPAFYVGVASNWILLAAVIVTCMLPLQNTVSEQQSLVGPLTVALLLCAVITCCVGASLYFF